MPITISLLETTVIPELVCLTPTTYQAIAVGLDEEPNDKGRWGVLADWLDANDEPKYAHAARWIAKRDAVQVKRQQYRNGLWEFDYKGIPLAVREKLPEYGGSYDAKYPAVSLCKLLAVALDAIRAELL